MRCHYGWFSLRDVLPTCRAAAGVATHGRQNNDVIVIRSAAIIAITLPRDVTVARLPRRLEQRDGNTLRRQHGGSAQTRQPGPDDIGLAWLEAHPKLERRTSDSSLPLLSETRRRGGRKPAASLALRISQ